MKLSRFGRGPEPTVCEVPCGNQECSATVPVTQTLLDLVQVLNGIQERRNEPPLDRVALCPECHRMRREFLEERGAKRHEYERHLWNEFRAGRLSEEKLLDAVGDKNGTKQLIERRRKWLEEKQQRKTRPKRESAVFGGTE